jgi:hypothetical protein
MRGGHAVRWAEFSISTPWAKTMGWTGSSLGLSRSRTIAVRLPEATRPRTKPGMMGETLDGPCPAT